MYHNPINEIFECIPQILEHNQKAQDETRNTRRVGYGSQTPEK